MNHLYLSVENTESTLEPKQAVRPASVRQLKSIQLVRGVAALLVVSYHLSLFSDTHYGKIKWLSQLLGQGYAGVDLFFAISGFVIAYSVFREDKKKPSLLNFSIKRFIRVFPTYWVMVGVFWIACRITYGAVPQADREVKDWITAFFLLPNHSIIIPVSWSLSYELFFYFLVGLVIYSQRFWVVCAMVLIGTISYLSIPKSSIPAVWFICSNYNLEFFGGVAIAFSLRLKPFHQSVYWFILLLTVLWLIVCPTTTPDNLDGRILLYGTSSLGLIFGLTGLERNRIISISSPFIKLGDASYIIYLLHPSALVFLYKYVENRPSLPLWVFVCLAIGLMLGISWVSVLSHYELEKPLIDRVNKWANRKKQLTSSFSEWGS